MYYLIRIQSFNPYIYQGFCYPRLLPREGGGGSAGPLAISETVAPIKVNFVGY